jgi:hypothetical protein
MTKIVGSGSESIAISHRHDGPASLPFGITIRGITLALFITVPG